MGIAGPKGYHRHGHTVSLDDCRNVGGDDIFVMKPDGDGHKPGPPEGSRPMIISSICTDQQGNIHITGYTPGGRMAMPVGSQMFS
jgi:hypothetical protein